MLPCEPRYNLGGVRLIPHGPLSGQIKARLECIHACRPMHVCNSHSTQAARSIHTHAHTHAPTRTSNTHTLAHAHAHALRSPPGLTGSWSGRAHAHILHTLPTNSIRSTLHACAPQPTLLDEDLEREGVDAAVSVVKARATAIAEAAFWDSVSERLKAGLLVGARAFAFC